MSIDNLDKRLHTIREINQDYHISYPIIFVTLLIIVLIGLGFLGVENFWQSLYPNLISVIITVGVLNVIERNRERKKQSDLHNILNWNYGKNPDAPITHRIFFEMIIRDALANHVTSYFDISTFKCEGFKIRKAAFQHCNMQKTQWSAVDFSCSSFGFVDLRNASFLECVLDYSKLMFSRFESVNIINTSIKESTLEIDAKKSRLVDVDLQNSNLARSSFVNSVFHEVNLKGANLKDVNLAGANFFSCQFNGLTVLPDGHCYDIAAGVEQLERYTKISHPDFFKVETASYGLDHVPHYIQPNNEE
jgi:uncharacterized protein YjbI with pentapeptide repeats